MGQKVEQHSITWYPLKHYWTLYQENAPSVYALTLETRVYCVPGTTQSTGERRTRQTAEPQAWAFALTLKLANISEGPMRGRWLGGGGFPHKSSQQQRHCAAQHWCRAVGWRWARNTGWRHARRWEVGSGADPNSEVSNNFWFLERPWAVRQWPDPKSTVPTGGRYPMWVNRGVLLFLYEFCTLFMQCWRKIWLCSCWFLPTHCHTYYLIHLVTQRQIQPSGRDRGSILGRVAMAGGREGARPIAAALTRSRAASLPDTPSRGLSRRIPFCPCWILR